VVVMMADMVKNSFSTRKRFMQNLVNKEPFTHFPRTVDMLEVGGIVF